MTALSNTSSYTFKRKIDKNIIPTCNILGVNIAAINMDWLIKFTQQYIHELAGDYMCVSNVHTTIMSYEDNNYRAIQNSGVMAIPDGGPLCVVGKKRSFKNMERTAGPSYMEEIFKISSQIQYRHFFYGSTKMTLKKMEDKLKEKYPDIQIVGSFSPPFTKISTKEDERIIHIINETNPDFVWIGLGAPKQEEWMHLHQGRINGFMVGVGAGFDYFAGNIKRAPKWMQKNNLEWLYRLIQDPKRLMKRYLRTNVKYIWLTFLKGK